MLFYTPSLGTFPGKMLNEVYGYTFRGSKSVIYIFDLLLKRGLLSKERICSSLRKFFPLRVNLSLKRLGKQIGSHRSCSPS